MTSVYQQEYTEVLSGLKTDPETGLSEGDVAGRIQQYGPNELIESGIKSPWKILWEQVSATMVLILIAAAVISGFLGEMHETVAIASIVVLFVLLGFNQEYRAEKAMAALKNMSVPFVRVRRNSTVQDIPSSALVPGDILLLESGNIVPADCRLIESVNLRIQESALTGESEPVEKIVAVVEGDDVPLGDRRNMAYMGTIVTFGRGTAVVVDTGMRAELGKIASLIQAAEDEQTPLQRRLDGLGKGLAIIGVAMAVIVALVEYFVRSASITELFVLGVSIAVAIVPEGLPAVVTFTLAIGARRMLKRNALIRKLPAVETLGSVTVICSDKTGTLTENRMTVLVLDVAGHSLDAKDKIGAVPMEINGLLVGGMVCNDATIVRDADTGQLNALGDPTETALLRIAAEKGLDQSLLSTVLTRVGEIPFASERKRMTTVHRVRTDLFDSIPKETVDAIQALADGASLIAFTKGSVDGLLDISDRVWVHGAPEAMTEGWRQRIEASNNTMAANGMRVLGVAYRSVRDEDVDYETLESGLIFIGFVGIIDPPRTEAREAVEQCVRAGIRPVMITGDHPLTAQAIARELGIADRANALTGQQLNAMSSEELETVVDDVRVFARVSPEHKLRIVDALQAKGHITAMTGDGVNDAPALKSANIGVAMGISGTDVAKEASDMVLLDDNFRTIVSAVEEGRTIYDNVLKFVKFSVAGNIGKVGVMLLAPILAMPLPLEALQLLWLNLLTDGLLGLGMGMEAPEKGSMDRPPYSPNASIFNGGMIRSVFGLGGTMAVLTVFIGYWYYNDNHVQWQTMIFTALTFCQVGQALASRSARRSALGLSLLANKTLMGMIIVVLIAQALVVYLPILQSFFHTHPLSAADSAICIGCAVLMFLAIEIEKLILRKRT